MVWCLISLQDIRHAQQSSIFCGSNIVFNNHFDFIMDINFPLLVVLNAIVDEDFSFSHVKIILKEIDCFGELG